MLESEYRNMLTSVTLYVSSMYFNFNKENKCKMKNRTYFQLLDVQNYQLKTTDSTRTHTDEAEQIQ